MEGRAMADIVAGERFVTSERDPARERRAQRALLFVIVLLLLVISGQIVYHLVVAPQLSISQITVHSEVGIREEELLRAAHVQVGMLFFQADPQAIAARLESFAEVRTAGVERVFPDKLIITVRRRMPLAAAVVATNNGSRTVLFDDAGVVFQVGADATGAALPVVSGLRFPEARVGLELPSLVVEFLRQLRSLQLNDPELYALFSEFRIVPRNDYSYEVVLYPMHFPVPVRIGAEINAEMVQYVMMMLDVLRSEGELARVEELDMRSGDTVIRYRERLDG